MSVYRATINMLMYGQLCQNVLYFKKVDDTPATDVQALADDLDANWVAQIKVPLAGDVNFFKIDVHVLGSTPYFYSKAIVQNGGNGADSACPLNVAWVLQKESGLGGRHNRGRIFCPGLRPGYLTNGLINSTGQALWPTRITNLNNRYCGASPASAFHLILYNEKGADYEGPAVSALQLRTSPGSMRRRMLGVGQ
jgi:hypothetical protein